MLSLILADDWDKIGHAWEVLPTWAQIVVVILMAAGAFPSSTPTKGVDVSELLFSSDLHFGHDFMAKLRSGDHEPRGNEPKQPAGPFFRGAKMTTDEMDEWMIEEWNAHVRPNDEVFFLGDLSFHKSDETARIFAALNGQKHLARGNHDGKPTFNLPWKSVFDFGRRSFDGHTFYMMHYPLLTWPNAHKGTYHLHGHSHGNLKAPQSTRMDVGPDATGQMLISAEECKTILDARTYDFIDHHD